MHLVAGSKYPDAIEQTKQWFAVDSSNTTQVEGGKFFIVCKDHSYGLFRSRDGEIIGWLTLSPTRRVFDQDAYPLGNIQILPKYRNSVAILVLLNALRSMVDRPIYIDDPIFKDGHSLLSAIAKRRGIASVFTVDKKTGAKTPYTPADLSLQSDVGILLEQCFIKLTHTDRYPGGSRELSLELFAGLTTDLE